MRLVRYEKDGEIGIAVDTANGMAPVGYADLIRFITGGGEALEHARKAAEQGPYLYGGRLLAPLDNPGKLLCSGINYASHKDENPHAVLPERPSVFAKLPSAIIGPDDSIVIPPGSVQVDYEVELAFIIGKSGKRISREQAMEYVFGYTIMNDVSERELQMSLQHETIGKGIDTFSPLGPAVVLMEAIPDPARLQVSSYLNGKCMQSASVSELLFDIPTLIAFISQYITLHPGDIISTGTPAGTGLFRNPQVFLRPGDTVEVEVNGIGRLRNPVTGGDGV